MTKNEQRAELIWLPLATAAAIVAIVAGALFLIAPVWQPTYHVVDYKPPQGAVQQETADGTSEECIDINTATAAQLMGLDGVGESKAAAIIAYREEYGRFTSTEQLTKIAGISQRMVDGWADKIFIEASNESSK